MLFRSVNGLVCVDNVEEMAVMVSASREVKTLEVLVDEKTKIRTLYDDVILNGCPPMAKVVTLRKMARSFKSGEGTSDGNGANASETEEPEDAKELVETGEG